MESRLRDSWLGQTLRGTEKVSNMRGMTNAQLLELLIYMPDTAPHDEGTQRSRRETFEFMFDRRDRGINLGLARRPDLPDTMKQILREEAENENDQKMIEALAEGDRPVKPAFEEHEYRAG
ncbi:MAG: hypothetical protein GC137_02630 [Alphaproteobacteria bacterium]|nr:hypothetical protein [Alphaproteobacteria bacterium]